MLPRYRGVDAADLHPVAADVPFGANHYPVRFFERPMGERVTAVFVDAPELYDRDGLYGSAAGDYADNGFRFAVLAAGALEYARRRNSGRSSCTRTTGRRRWRPCTSGRSYADPVLGGVPSRVHDSQPGVPGALRTGLAPLDRSGAELFRVDALEFWGRISFLKGGIVVSQTITTVSRRYAREIQTPEFGFGFDGILRAAHRIWSASSTASTSTRGIRRTDPLPARALHGRRRSTARRTSKRALLEQRVCRRTTPRWRVR